MNNSIQPIEAGAQKKGQHRDQGPVAKSDLERLLEFTAGCRPDMHEPDEQDIYAELGPTTAKTYGGDILRTSFDNACTAEMSYDMGFWLIKREYYDDGSYHERREWFNLACIVALARRASHD